jgi:hypothetical protein
MKITKSGRARSGAVPQPINMIMVSKTRQFETEKTGPNVLLMFIF